MVTYVTEKLYYCSLIFFTAYEPSYSLDIYYRTLGFGVLNYLFTAHNENIFFTKNYNSVIFLVYTK